MEKRSECSHSIASPLMIMTAMIICLNKHLSHKFTEQSFTCKLFKSPTLAVIIESSSIPVDYHSCSPSCIQRIIITSSIINFITVQLSDARQTYTCQNKSNH